MKIIFSIILAAFFSYSSQCLAMPNDKQQSICEKKPTILQVVQYITDITLDNKPFFDSITKIRINGYSLLHVMIRDSEALKYLLAIASDRLTDQQLFFNLLTQKTTLGNTPLHIAACHNSESLKYILDIASTYFKDNRQLFFDLLNQENKDGVTPLYIAAWKNSEAFKYLLDIAFTRLNDQQLLNLLNQQNKDGQTSLHAAAWGNNKSLKYLLDAASSCLNNEQFFFFLTQKTIDGYTPLSMAAVKNNFGNINYLIEVARKHLSPQQFSIFTNAYDKVPQPNLIS